MTDVSHGAAQLNSAIRKWCEAWKSCLQSVISQVAGSTHSFEISAQPVEPGESDLWYTVTSGGAVRGEMTLRIPAASGTTFAQIFLGGSVVSQAPVTQPLDAISAEEKEAVEELLRQVAGLAATILSSDAGGEVQLHLSHSAAPAWSSDAVMSLQGDVAEDSAVRVEIQISPALAAELQPRELAATAVGELKPGANTPQSSAVSAASYRRLMEVGLDVKLRFGTRRMLLRDILALSAGVVVELENSLHSPVDLLLDGRLIAHGDVVIVDGKYGLRVTDVVDSTPPARISANS